MMKIMKKILFGIFCTLTGAFVTLGALIAASAIWMFHTWANLTADELVYHMTNRIEGTSNDILYSFAFKCALPTLLVLCAYIVLSIIIRKKIRSQNWGRKRIYLWHALCIVTSFITILITAGVSYNLLDLDAYISNKTTYSTFIDDHYVDPDSVAITFPDQKRNLIYIYLESVEMTYSDIDNGGAFDVDCIPELTEISEENENFSGENSKLNGAETMSGCTWTMGAIYGQSAGLPLNIPIDGNSMYAQDSFLPRITAIGDILNDAGYKQVFMCGSYAVFGGRQQFFLTHGNYDLYDYQYAVDQGWIPSDHYVWWGLEDYILIDHAKECLLDLADQGQPFNFTILTADTHFEDGYVCEDCPDTCDTQYANVMACSSKRISEFLQWIQEQDFYDNTTVVITGDHLTMDSDFCENIADDYNRRVLTVYINSPVENTNTETRLYSQFDEFPTTLASLGVQIEGDRLGLGTNLYSRQQTLLERYGEDYMMNEIQKNSKLLDRINSDIDVTRDQMKEDGSGVIKGTGDGSDQEEGAEEETEEDEQDQNIWVETNETGDAVVKIKNVPDSTTLVQVAYWMKEDQSDLVWTQAQPQEDGTYQTVISSADQVLDPGDYNVHVYTLSNDMENIFFGYCTYHKE